MKKKKGFHKVLTCFACATLIATNFTLPQIKAKQAISSGMYQNTLQMLDAKEGDDTMFPVGNLALGKSVNVSGLEVDGKWTGEAMVDGDKEQADSRWSSGIMRPDMNASAQQNPQWAIIDLKASDSQISEINIYYHLMVWGTDYDIQTASSIDGEWETLETIAKEDSTEKNPVHTVSKTMNAKRYIRFYFRKMNTKASGNALSIKEIEINGTQIIEGNLAYQKPTKVSDLEVAGKWTGDKAVDGEITDNDSRWSSGIMRNNMSDPASLQTPQWITIDLKSDVSLIESIDIYYYLLVWGTKYEIQTADKLDGEWRTLETITKENGNERNPVETIAKSMLADRYIRFYYERMNTNAGGNALSIREIQIQGKQMYTPDDGETATSAKEIINNLKKLDPIDIHSKQVTLPKVPDNYSISIKGSDVENVISNDGVISAYNIGDRDVDLIVQVINKDDKDDTAEKSYILRVPDKTPLYPDMYPEVTQANPKPEVLPAIQEWYGYEGHFQLGEDSRILVNDQHNLDLMKAAERIQSDIKDITKLDLEIARVDNESAILKNDIYLASLPDDTYQLGKEGYLSIANDLGMRIYSASYTGALYGSVTALQILSQNRGECTIPYGVIRDYPKYEVRGMMLDIARMPYRLPLLKDVSKYLSWFKMNELHLHVNDDFGDSTEGMFRLESTLYPSLKTNSKRGVSASNYFQNVYGEPHYTKEEYCDLQFLANDYGVNIITEIDSPGHSKAFNDYARDNPDQLDWLGPDKLLANPRSDQFLDLTGANAPRAKRFITSLFDEFTSGDEPMFTSDIVHIGADEYWNATTSEKEELRKYAVMLHDVLQKNGKKARMWGQMKAYPGVTLIPNDIQLDLWYTGYEDVKARLKDGFQLINLDEGYMYGNSGRNRRDVMNIEYVYENWDPTIFNGVTVMKGEPNLIGGKTALWADENRQGVIERDLQERIVRQMAVTSEKTWGGTTSSVTYDQYEYKFTKVRDCPNTAISMQIESKSSLVASYNMENIKDGTLYDDSGNAYDANIKNGQVVKEDGTTYMKFDGTTTIQSPLQTLSYPYTVSFDVKVGKDDHNSEDASLFSGYDGRLQAAGINGSMSINRVMYGQTMDYTLTSNKANITIVGTFEGTKIYINGKLHKFLYRNDPNNNKYQPDNLLSSFVFPLETIGKGFQGYLGNIDVFNKALSADVIANHGADQNVNVAQNIASAQDIQNVNEGYWDEEAKKINVAWKAFDGDGRDLSGHATGVTSEKDSKWNGGVHDAAWLSGDLGVERTISSVRIQWNAPGYAKAFKIQTSLDNKTWTDAYETNSNTSDLSEITFDKAIPCRYIRMQGIKRNGSNNYSIQEFEAFEHVDKTALHNLVDEVESVVEEQHLQFGDIRSSYQAFFDAYVYANALLDNPMATIAEVTKAQENLQKAFDEVSSDTNKDALNQVLIEAKGYIDDHIYDMVPNDEADAFQAVYEKTLAVYDNAQATQIEIDAAIQELQAAIAQITFIRDRLILQKLIGQCDDMDMDQYEDTASKDTFKEVLQEAKVMIDAASHKAIIEMTKKLIDAKTQLVIKEDTTLTKTILKSAIDKAEMMIQTEDFTKLAKKVQELMKANYHQAVLVYDDEQATNQSILQAWYQLADALQYGDFRTDKAILKHMLDAYKDIDLEEYTSGSAANFKTAYDAADLVYHDDDALQARIDEAYMKLDQAIKALVRKGESHKDVLRYVLETIRVNMQDESKYKKDDAWKIFQTTMSDAQRILDQQDASQNDINRAIQNVALAYENLRLLPSEDQLAAMKVFIMNVRNMNRQQFTNAELAIIDSVYAQVKGMMNDFNSKRYASLSIKMDEVSALIEEKAQDEILVNTPDTAQKQEVTKANNSAIPMTGDTTNIAIPAFLLGISGYVASRMRKKNK